MTQTVVPRSLFVYALLYGGLVCMAGVLGTKIVAIGPLTVEAGIFAFLQLVVLSSAVSELHGAQTAQKLVRYGFIPLILSALLIQLVIALPPAHFWTQQDAFKGILGQGSRLMLAGLVSYGISQTLNVMLFNALRSGTGKLVWHALGAKTIELIHQNVHVDSVRDDLETLVLDAELLEAVMGSPDPKKRAKEFETKLTARLRKHMGNPKYRHLSERLEALKERHEQGLLNSVEFLKHLLEIARDLVSTEKDTPPEEDEDRGKAALTELFQQVKNEKTPVMVERVVADIDEIVRLVRFPGWQTTAAGEREVKKALRKSLLKYQLHQDAELFERAYGYIRQYY